MPNAILLVDDDPIQIEIMSAFFRANGHAEILAAENGLLARALFRSKAGEIALIVCDLNMPENNGIELINELASLACRSAIVLVTGAERHIARSAEIIATANQLRVLGVLRKPVDLDALGRLTAAALAGAAAAAAS